MDDEISRQIRRVNDNEPGANDALFSAAYHELRKLARCRLHEGGYRLAMDTTELVHESYLRLQNQRSLRCGHRSAFFAYASTAMRSVIVDAMRASRAERRGGDAEVVRLDTTMAESLHHDDREAAQVRVALSTLAESEPRLAKVVELRYFGGYNEVEIGEKLGLTDRTVRRDWEKARLLLSRLM